MSRLTDGGGLSCFFQGRVPIPQAHKDLTWQWLGDSCHFPCPIGP